MLQFIPFQEKDFQVVIDCIQSPRFLLQWGGPMFHYPLTHQQLLEYKKAPDRKAFQVYDANEGRVIGHISIGRIDLHKNQGRIGKVLVFPQFRKKGYGIKMMEAFSTYAFQTLGLERLTLGVFDFNTKAIHCYKKAGFTIDRHLKNHRSFGNEKWNLYEMSLEKLTPL